jgi:hypothetical protein
MSYKFRRKPATLITVISIGGKSGFITFGRLIDG